MLSYPRFIRNEYSFFWYYFMIFFLGSCQCVFFLSKFGPYVNPPALQSFFVLGDPLLDAWTILVNILTMYSYLLMILSIQFCYNYILRINETTRWSHLNVIIKNYICEVYPIRCDDEIGNIIESVNKNL